VAVSSEIRNRVAIITLNRPEALNALSYEMIMALRSMLEGCADQPEVRAILLKGAGDKAFCAGGDIRSLYQSFKDGKSQHREFFLAEYALDFMLHSFPKPYVALMDGITMGGGMGLGQPRRCESWATGPASPCRRSESACFRTWGRVIFYRGCRDRWAPISR
jgi:enoyl-CoA hydratase/carnithine racemase